MQQKRDLSLVHGVTPSRRRALEEAGVADAAALAVADLGALAARTELPRETLRRLRIQAESLADGAPRALGKPLWRAARIAWAAAAARDPRGTHISEFMLYRTAKAGDRLEESWHHAHAAEPADEERAYRKMLHSLRDDRDAPIYHYGPGFPDSLAALDAKYGKAGDGLNAIFDRLSDVQSALRSALVLPVHSYDLETVARNLGIDVEPLKPGDASAALRRRLASEVKSIRAVRVAAQRAWERAQLLQSAHPAQTQDSAVAGATQSRGAEEPAIGATPP
jgi:predicted RecB family nuclease